MKRQKVMTPAQEEELRRAIFEWRSPKEIIDLFDLGYSPLQIISLFLFENAHFVRRCQMNPDSVFQFKTSRLITRFRKFLPYSREQHKLHLSMPQWWKIRFRHLDKTEEEVKKLVDIQLQNWASNSHEIRRKKGTPYNPKQTLQYWIDLGYLEEDAQRKLIEFKRSCSPFTVEFWKKKGLTDEQAQEKATSLHKKGGIATCSSLDKKFVSKLERDIFNHLQSRISRPLKQQHSIADKFIYDICDLKYKKIIEINGAYWHADPRVYSSEDMIVCNGLTAAAIRERDSHKNEYAKNLGYQVLVIWEIDWHSDKEASIQRMLEFLG